MLKSDKFYFKKMLQKAAAKRSGMSSDTIPNTPALNTNQGDSA
jgi:hypothetical protein